MRQLLAFLLVRLSDGSWQVGSHRGLETLLSAWRSVPDAGACGVIHVGFWRPDTIELEAAATKCRGTVLLTEAAKWAFPDSFRTSSRPVASVGDLLLYLGLSGWGYEMEDDSGGASLESLPEPESLENEASPPVDEPWLDSVRHGRPELWQSVVAAGIVNDATYLSFEHNLASGPRDDLAFLRFRWFSGAEPSAATILKVLRLAPPWLLEMDVSALTLSTRPSNRLAEEKLLTVGDVAQFGESRLMKIPAMGRGSVAEISQRIVDAFRNGSAYCSRFALVGSNSAEPDSQAERIPESIGAEPDRGTRALKPSPSRKAASARSLPLPLGSVPVSFHAGVQIALSLCEQREAKVLRLRMGLWGARQTLDRVGSELAVSRERARQIEKRAVQRIAVLMRPLIERAAKGIHDSLHSRSEPLPLVGLEILDPWFAGVGENAGPLDFVMEHFYDERRFWILKIGEETYVSGINLESWIEAVRKTKALLGDLVRGEKSIPEQEARCLTESMLPESAAELRPLLWGVTTRWANFLSTPTGERRLVSFGHGAESVVEAVLLESDRPLHYQEIAKRCEARGKPLEIRRAHSAAACVGILLAPGTFGLDRHFPLDEEETESVISEVESMIFENPGRQWHADEIADGLGDRGLDFGGRLNKYAVNHALKQSRSLVYLGRLVWAVRSGKARGKADRISVWQAVAALLDENGGPMRTAEIRDRLSKDRGLGATPLLIVQYDPVIRVGEGSWGLLWRDVPFSEEEAGRIVDEMEAVCRCRGEALHVSEIVGALQATAELAGRPKDPTMLVSLAVRTGRMKAARGGYVHPVEWEGSRRLCSNEAVSAALDEAGPNGSTLHTLAALASRFLGREIPPSAGGRLLISVGAVYDEERGVWAKPEPTSASDDERDADGSSDDSDDPRQSGEVAGSDFPPSATSGVSTTSTAQGA